MIFCYRIYTKWIYLYRRRKKYLERQLLYADKD